MITTSDIKRITAYQLEVFKDVFWTKEEGKRLEEKLDRIQTTMDTFIKKTSNNSQEITVLNHRVKSAENWIDQAAPKIGLEFKH